jgi:hypothetical protein
MSTTWHADELSKVSRIVEPIVRMLMGRNESVGLRSLRRNSLICSSAILLPIMFMLQRISLLPSDPYRPLASESYPLNCQEEANEQLRLRI